jgi:hypothetical protein
LVGTPLQDDITTQEPKTPAASAPKIIGKFKPLILAEVHAAANT